MARSDAYTNKQKRQAEHITEGYEKRGLSERESKRRAWATVNKESGGGKKSGSGRSHSKVNLSSKSGEQNKSISHAKRSAAAKKGWATRRQKGSS